MGLLPRMLPVLLCRLFTLLLVSSCWFTPSSAFCSYICSYKAAPWGFYYCCNFFLKVPGSSPSKIKIHILFFSLTLWMKFWHLDFFGPFVVCKWNYTLQPRGTCIFLSASKVFQFHYNVSVCFLEQSETSNISICRKKNILPLKVLFQVCPSISSMK